MTTEELLKLTVETLDRKKGMDIKALKVTDLTVIADYFVIVTGTSPTHIKALSDDLEDKLAEKGKNAKSVEGKATGWILLDYGTVIVHVFTKESRENFNLEKLWGDAEEVDVSEWRAFSTPLTIPISPNFTDLSNFHIRAEQVCT